MDNVNNIPLQCTFCDSTKFKINNDYSPKPGDKLTCSHCGKESDFSSMKRNVIEKGRNWAMQEARKLQQNAIKDINKAIGKNKMIKIS